ncbi:hypothetical protein ACIA78_12640 [Streptomyces xanthochromogenes]|uniref:hypothetical protein n=1 Tax=Streptomyces xanthochromogenes TaxID=67384 RepID=UPI0037B2B5C6
MCQEVAFRHERWDENDHFGTEPWISDVVPAGCAATMSLRVLALDRLCWKCGEATTCVVGLYPSRPSQADCYAKTMDESSRVWIKELLEEAGYTQLADSIKPRWSATVGRRYLSNGCLHCDALQGDFPVEEEASDLVREEGVGALSTLLVVEVPAPVWQRVVHGDHGEGGGLLM